MKKLLTIVVSLILLVCLGGGLNAMAAPSDEWSNNDAVVSQEIMQLLKDRAGFSAYINTNTPINMNPENVSTFKIEEKSKDYFVGSFYENSTKVLVTKGGLIVSFSPRETAHATFSQMLHTEDVKKAVKIFVGPTIENMNYFNFQSPTSNRAFFFYYGGSTDLKIPNDAKVNAVGYNYSFGNYNLFKGYYGTILAPTLQPGITHKVDNYGRDIDGITVYNQITDGINIFYTSNSSITSTRDSWVSYILRNKFRTSDETTPTPPSEKKELQSIQLSMDAADMKPNTSQSISVVGTYKDGTQGVIDGASVNWTVSNPVVARVVDGRMDALTYGSTAIFATVEGKTAVVNVDVHNFKVMATKYNQPLNKKWTITTNQNVNSTTVNSNTVTVIDSRGNKIPVRYSTSGGIITVTPVLNYKSGESYTLWVRNINSSSGKMLSQQTKMEFTTK